MENITKTFNSTKYNCIAFNRSTKNTDNISVMLNKDFGNDAALKIITKKFGTSTLVFMDVIGKEAVQEKRTMPVETFMQYAVVLEKPNPALVTRTVKRTGYLAVIYDRVEKITDTYTLELDKNFDDDEKALKALQKRFNGDTMLVVDILGKETIETLYGITPEEFIKHSKVVDDSKEG